MKIVEVEWKDAYGGEFQIDLKSLEFEQPLIVKSVGYLVFRNKDRLGLAFMIYEKNNSAKSWQIIPTKMVIKIKEIK